MAQEYQKNIEETFKRQIWDEAKEIAKNNPEIITDVTGIFDPTPASDAISTIVAMAKGDWLGAGLSAVSMIPGLGDALAKPAKFARYGQAGEKIAGMLKTMFEKSNDLAKSAKAMAGYLSRDQVLAAQRRALEKVRKKLLNARKNDPNCKKCAEFKAKLKLPDKGGKWKPPGANDPNSPDFGNGTFTFDEPKMLPDGTTVESVTYKNGFPDFGQYVVGGKHGIVDMTGIAKTDARLLEKQLGVTAPGAPGEYTLHHFPDGSVGYVATSIHTASEGGVAHTGGGSMIGSDLF